MNWLRLSTKGLLELVSWLILNEPKGIGLLFLGIELLPEGFEESFEVLVESFFTLASVLLFGNLFKSPDELEMPVSLSVIELRSEEESESLKAFRIEERSILISPLVASWAMSTLLTSVD